jgi:hypothetical protein
MTREWMNRLGNWNPQLLRELRGRLKGRSVTVAIVSSATVQILLLLIFEDRYGDARDWLELFRIISWLLVYGLLVAGSYTLISDIIQEQQRGTLDFIRLSPRSSQTILLGKLLGIPILPYISVALTIPLHLVCAGLAGVSGGLLLSFYVILLGITSFIFTLALVVAFLNNTSLTRGNRQGAAALSFCALIVLFLIPGFMAWNNIYLWGYFNSEIWPSFNTGNGAILYWFYLPISQNIWLAHGFTLLNLGIGTYFFWQVLQRRFQNSSATFISKKQSYGLVAYSQILALGFFLRSNMVSEVYEVGLLTLYVLNFILFLVLIGLLSPSRQLLLDWNRYERRNYGFWANLIWVEKSPAIVAIALNLLIAYGLLIPWIRFGIATPQTRQISLFVFAALAGIVLIYALIVQRILGAKIRNPTLWAAGTIVALLILPALTLTILQIFPEDALGLWTFLGFPFSSLTTQSQVAQAQFGLVCQWLVVGFLGWRLRTFLGGLAKTTQ